MSEEIEKVIQHYLDNEVPKIMKESDAYDLMIDTMYDEILFGTADWASATERGKKLVEEYMLNQTPGD